MPTITAIKSQKKNSRVNVYLDGKFGFGIDLDNFVKLGLRVEQELTIQEIERIVKKAELQKTLDKLIRFVTLRPRSEKEAKEWFIRKKIHESIREELVRRIKKLNLINDTKFAQWWITQRLSFRPMGEIRLKQELLQKGIDRSLIDNLLKENVDPSKLKDQAIEILARKVKSFANLPYEKQCQKAYGFLARRGFTHETTKYAIDEVLPRE